MYFNLSYSEISFASSKYFSNLLTIIISFIIIYSRFHLITLFLVISYFFLISFLDVFLYYYLFLLSRHYNHSNIFKSNYWFQIFYYIFLKFISFIFTYLFKLYTILDIKISKQKIADKKLSAILWLLVLGSNQRPIG